MLGMAEVGVMFRFVLDYEAWQWETQALAAFICGPDVGPGCIGISLSRMAVLFC
jgi:hypothetical protein